MKKNTVSRSDLSFLVGFFLLGFTLWGQGGDLLIQQYRRGPALDAPFSKWTVFVGPTVQYLNTDLATTSPTFTLGAISTVEYALSKSFRLKTGVGYLPVQYKFTLNDSLQKDRISYFSIPLGIALYPTDRTKIEIGGNYELISTAKQLTQPAGKWVKEDYEKGLFFNTFGIHVKVGYTFWQKFHLYAAYRFAKRNTPLSIPKSSNHKGYQLGVVYRIFSSRN